MNINKIANRIAESAFNHMEEKLYPEASAFLQKAQNLGFKGVPNKPKKPSFGHALPVAGKLANRDKVDYYIIPTQYYFHISSKSDAKKSYNLGQGWRVTPDGKCYVNKIKGVD